MFTLQMHTSAIALVLNKFKRLLRWYRSVKMTCREKLWFHGRKLLGSSIIISPFSVPSKDAEALASTAIAKQANIQPKVLKPAVWKAFVKKVANKSFIALKEFAVCKVLEGTYDNAKIWV